MIHTILDSMQDNVKAILGFNVGYALALAITILSGLESAAIAAMAIGAGGAVLSLAGLGRVLLARGDA